MDENPISALAVTVDTLVARGPCLLWGWTGGRASATAQVVLRDGQNVGAPLKIDFEVPTANNGSCVLFRPILFRNGLFVDLGANMASITILYEPIREEQQGARVEEPGGIETE